MSNVPLVDSLPRELPARRPAAPGSAAPTITRRTARNHRLVGVAVVLFVVLLQATNQYLSGHEASRVLGHLCFLSVELPAVLVALSVTYTELKRRHLGPTAAVGVTVLVAGTLGAGFGVLLCAVSQRFPGVLLRPMPNFKSRAGRSTASASGSSTWGSGPSASRTRLPSTRRGPRTSKRSSSGSAASSHGLRANLEPHFPPTP